MKTNFQFLETHPTTIEIKFQNEIIDLHNACYFERFTFDIVEETFTLYWRYYHNYKVDDWKNFQMKFSNIYSLNIDTWKTNIPFKQNCVFDEVKVHENKTKWIFNGDLKIEIMADNIQMRFMAKTGPKLTI
jgi:hypothetical protein